MNSNLMDQLPIEHRPQVANLEFKTWGAEPDFQRITKIQNAAFQADGIEHFASAPEMQNYYDNLPGFSSESDAFFASISGEPVAWTSIQPRNEVNGPMVYRHLEMVLPEWRGQGLSQALMTLAEKRAEQLAQALPDGRSAVLEVGLSEGQQSAIERVQAKGYQPTRYFFFMVRPLSQPIPDLPLPAGFHQRPVKEADRRPIWEAHHRAFEEHWGHPEITEEHYQMFINNPLTDSQLWQIAWHENEVAGMVLNVLDEDENAALGRRRGYTEDIAVLKPYRQQGLAKALISQSMRMFKEMGMEETALSVDTSNPTGALRLYQSLGYQTDRKSTAYRKTLS